MAIVIEPHVISLLQAAFPDAQVAVGVDQVALRRERVITVNADAQPIGEHGRGVLWTVDFSVLDTDRTRGVETAHGILTLLEDAVTQGRLPVSGVKIIDLPTVRVNATASQAHSATHCAVRFSAHYG